MKRDFTLDAYGTLVEAILYRGLQVHGVKSWILARPISGAVVRHDVDRSPCNALRMAEFEAALGLRTTYYFRVVGSAFDRGIMRTVHALGHEVGYHYEDLALARGNRTEALRLFARHLELLREVVPIDTVAMHGSPLSRHNNLGMWEGASPKDFGLLGDAFTSIDHAGVHYFTDTGRAWDAAASNMRDRPPGAAQARLSQPGTPGLVAYLRANPVTRLSLSVHPERWNSTTSGWCLQYARDKAANAAKRLIRLVR